MMHAGSHFRRRACPASFHRFVSAAVRTATTLPMQLRFGFCYTTHTPARSFPMKPGTVVEGLNFRKDRDPPVVQDDYPAWVRDLGSPMKTLNKLRRMPLEEATDNDKKRYLKLSRRVLIKEKNEESAKK